MTRTADTTPRVALTIAGSDSSAGAGAQADLKTFSALGVFGVTALTAVTAQNTVEVRLVHAVPVEVVDAQISAVTHDFAVLATKTGMLACTSTIESVARRARDGELPNLVVDPVLVSSSGTRLVDPEGERAYREKLLPYALIVTPNIAEAEALTGFEVSDLTGMERAARALLQLGPTYVVIKGGHLEYEDQSVDLVYDGTTFERLSSKRVDTLNLHGTGCTLSAAITAFLARGEEPQDAVRQAKEFLSRAIIRSAGWKLGSGQGPLDQVGLVELGAVVVKPPGTI